MATKSKITKKYATLATIFSLLSAMCMFGPLLIYAGMAFASGAAVVSKLIVASSLVVAAVLTLISVLGKWAGRCRVWIVLLGLSIALQHFLPMFYVFAATQILDELVICPLAAHFRNKKIINEQIDARV